MVFMIQQFSNFEFSCLGVNLLSYLLCVCLSYFCALLATCSFDRSSAKKM